MRNADVFARARRVTPGGVNSPVRAFKAVGGEPRFMASGIGATITDVEGKKYLDYIGSWGPMLLGHRHHVVVEALLRQAEHAFSFGAPTELEVEMAEFLTTALPAVEMVRLVNSGTEACMSAIRLARAATGRSYIIKFEGCYHGHADAFLARAGSGLATFGEPTSPGVPAETARLTLDATFNDLSSVAACFANFPGQIAGVIVEPAVGNMGCVQPAPGFLNGLRNLCTAHGTVLIFDEVMTGFRVAFGGMMEVSGVRPDLVCLGKVIGAGLPVGAYGGRRELMEHVAPLGAMYQAGTLSGNPLAMAAGLAQLRYISAHRATIYPKLQRDGAVLQSAVEAAARTRGLPVHVGRQGSMATVFFTDAPVRDWPSANRCDRARFALWFHHLLDAGYYFPPAQFEGYFHSAAHSDDDIARTADAMVRGLHHAFA